MAKRHSKKIILCKLIIIFIILIPALLLTVGILWVIFQQPSDSDLLHRSMKVTFSVEDESVNHEDREIMRDTKTSFIPSPNRVPAMRSKCSRRAKRNFETQPKTYQQIYDYRALKFYNSSIEPKPTEDDFPYTLLKLQKPDDMLTGNLLIDHETLDKEAEDASRKKKKKINTKESSILCDPKLPKQEVRKIQSEIMRKYIDDSVNPCTDFFAYACGNWEKHNPIPPDRISFDTFEQLREHLDEILRDMLEEDNDYEQLLIEKKEVDPDLMYESFEDIKPFENSLGHLGLRNIDNEVSRREREESVITIDIKYEPGKKTRIKSDDAINKAKDFYRSCMNEDILDKRGSKPLLGLLKKLGGWPIIDSSWDERKFDFIGLLSTLRLYNNDILISQWVGPDIKNSDEYVIQIDQTTLGLPTAECFLDPANLRYIHAYRVYIIHTATLLGATLGNATDDANDIVNFEIKLATITSPPDFRRNVTEIYSRLTLGELHGLIPQINWYRYLSIVLDMPIDMSLPVVVYCTDYLKKLIALLSTTDSKTIANYVLWRFVRHRTNNLDKRFDYVKQRFYNVILGREKIPPRWQACVSQVNSNLGMALGGLFVSRYFDENSKNDTLLMTKELQQSFRELLGKTDWLDSDTMNLAKSKINAMRLRIGYPDFILSRDELVKRYRDVTIHPGYYFENVLSILRHLTRVEQARVGMGVNKDVWNTAPAVVNAYYSRNKNQIMFPAGILQPPFYHRNFPKALNYGGIGVVIGHEITHGFDDKGRLFDLDGNLQRWWKDSSIEQFHQRSQCLIDQYNAYVIPEINEQVDGINTQGENIADNGGIKEAFHAYENWLKSHPNVDESMPGLNMTNKQLFFLNFAQVWCGSIRPEAAKNKLKTAVHAPGRFRVIGTLSNTEAFSQVFNCPVGSPMNPKDKCSIW